MRGQIIRHTTYCRWYMGRFSLIPDKKQKAGAKNVCLLYYHFEIVSSLK